MSFKKNIHKHIPIIPDQTNSLFAHIQKFTLDKVDTGELPKNKEIVTEFRGFIFNSYKMEVAQQQAYEILSMLLGYKNYNVALAKGVQFYTLFIENTKSKSILDNEWVDTLDQKPDVITLSDYSPSFYNNTQIRIPTGIQPLDEDLLGGLPSGGITSILGGNDEGKSLFCISLGCNAVRLEKKILHINLEGLRDEALKRYISNLSNISYSKIVNNYLSKEEVSIINSISQKYQNSIKIRNFLGFGTTIEKVMVYCRETYKDFKFDMLVINYGQLLETEGNFEYRLTMAKVFRELDSLAKELNCVVVTPIKISNSFQKTANSILRSSDVSDTFQIARVSEVIMTLNSNDQEKYESKMRIFLEKQKAGEKNKFYGVITDYSRSNLATGIVYNPKI